VHSQEQRLFGSSRPSFCRHRFEILTNDHLLWVIGVGIKVVATADLTVGSSATILTNDGLELADAVLTRQLNNNKPPFVILFAVLLLSSTHFIIIIIIIAMLANSTALVSFRQLVDILLVVATERGGSTK
jgi:hypothetical protein